MVAYKLKDRTKHHGWQDGQLVKLNPGAILKTVNPNFKDKFELIDDVPDDRIVKLDRPIQDRPTKTIIKEADGQKVLEEEKPEPPVAVEDETEKLTGLTPEEADELKSSEDDDDDDETRVLSVVHKRGSKYIVVDQDGEKIHTGYMTEKRAQEVAARG